MLKKYFLCAALISFLAINALAETGSISMGKILVVSASKYGSTTGVAEAVANTLREEGESVDVMSAADAVDVKNYSAVIVGSAIYMGQWRKDAIAFLEKNRQALSAKPVAFFIVCTTVKDPTDENIKKAAAFSDKAKAIVSPVDVGMFAGTIDISKMGTLDRILTKMVKAPAGDFRDWNAIKTWSKKIRPLLTRSK